jgi:cobyrinic acid a,c-diamide synthase
MTRIDGATAIRRVGWHENRDGLDVALAVNRLLSAEVRAWWLTTAHEAADAGDYLVELTSRQQQALESLGVATSAWRGDIPGDAQALTAPAACLFAGTASKFPYFAYYAVALLRLGIDYLPCDGPALASGALDDANVLILPGGFATWGIDAAENAPGADARVRDFLESGGTAVGSCGGAYYLLPVVRDGLEPRRRSHCIRTSTCKVAWAS